jgi:8-oxo-dGTP pyrophosphatase MutT (NUDIX family)
MSETVREIRERSLVRCLIADATTGLILIGLRSHRETFGSGLWEILQGSREEGETPSQAVLREIHEEIGVDVRPLLAAGAVQLLPVSDDHFAIEHSSGFTEDWSNINYLLIGHGLAERLGQLTIDDSHDELRWVSPDEAHQLLADHDYSVAGQRLIALLGELYTRLMDAASALRTFGPVHSPGEIALGLD